LLSVFPSRRGACVARLLACLRVLLCLAPTGAVAQDAVNLALNWVPRAEHMPFIFAQAQGWYRDAGIELTIESLTGSPAAVKRALESDRTFAVADCVPFLREWAQGASVIAVMALEPHSAYAIYSAAESGIRGVSDLSGKRIAAQPADPLRNLWPVFAADLSLAPSPVTWIDLANPAKPEALDTGEADAAFNPFLHNHLNYEAVLGGRMRVLWWHQAGFPAYGLVLAASVKKVQASPQLVQRFVAVTQRAYAHCLRSPQPCLNALLKEYPQLERDREQALWALVSGLYGDDSAALESPGAFDQVRVTRAVEQVRSAYRLPAGVARGDPFTNAFVRPE
jgi:NitT/TauT family transport system substrate-binding protein